MNSNFVKGFIFEVDYDKLEIDNLTTLVVRQPLNERKLMNTTPRTKTYAEMLAYAKNIHPRAKIRLSEYREWEIFIDLEIEETAEVGPEWDNTPAAKEYRLFNSKYGNNLLEWAKNKGYSYEPLEAIAARYNLQEEFHAWSRVRVEELLVEAGLPDREEIGLLREPNALALWQQLEVIRNVAHKEATEKFAAQEEALDIRYAID